MWFRSRITFDNFTMEVPKDMLWCFDDEYYEKNVLHWFSEIVRQIGRPVIYDIGANYGYYSLKFSSLATWVYAFEPVNRTCKVLSKNVIRNKLQNVRVYNCGLSDTEGEADIHLYSSSGNNSLFSRTLPPQHPLQCTGKEVITLARLDDLVERDCLLPPHLLKIDIEGGELSALRGGREIIHRHMPYIIMEYSESTSNDAGYRAKALLDELDRHGYAIYGLSEATDDFTLFSRDLFPIVNVANVVAAPRPLF